MKKILSLLAIGSLFLASQVSAVSYWDFDILPGDNGLLLERGESTSDVFDIVNSDGTAQVGYNPLTETIVGAEVHFLFLGLGNYVIELGSSVFSDSGVFLAKLDSGNVTGSALLSLSSTGSLAYTVTNDSNRNWKKINLTAAKLFVETEAKSVSVPDAGSSFALLGLGLLGLVGLSRRFSK